MLLLIFLWILFLVELMFSERICITICLVFTFAINTFEHIQIRLSFLGFKSRWVSLKVCLIIPCYFFIVFNFVRTIAFDTFRTMSMAHKSHVLLFPARIALWDARVHIHATNCCNVTANVETSVNKILSLGITLRILYSNLNNSRIRFRRSFDNMWVRSKNNIIKDMGCLNNFFNYIRKNRDISIFDIVWNAQDLEVWFGLW